MLVISATVLSSLVIASGSDQKERDCKFSPWNECCWHVGAMLHPYRRNRTHGCYIRETKTHVNEDIMVIYSEIEIMDVTPYKLNIRCYIRKNKKKHVNGDYCLGDRSVNGCYIPKKKKKTCYIMEI